MKHKTLAKLKLFGKKLLGYTHRKNDYNPRILHDYKCIFIHIPKTAGNSITAILTQLPKKGDNLSPKISKHAKAFEVKYLLGNEIWDQYFSFTFVRNPWELMVSSYHWWLQKAHTIKYHRRKAKKVAAMNGFDEFIQSKYGSDMINERYGNMANWYSEGGEIIVDYIGKVETIDEDWEKISEKLNIEHIPLPHKNKTDHRDYREYYTPETRELVANRFKKTITLFDYSF